MNSPKLWLGIPLIIVGCLLLLAAVSGYGFNADPMHANSIYKFNSVEGYIYGPICIVLAVLVILKREKP